MTPEDPRIDLIAEALYIAAEDGDDHYPAADWGSLQPVEQSWFIRAARKVLAAADAVDPLRAALGEPETEYALLADGEHLPVMQKTPTHERSVWRSVWRPVDPE